MIHSINGKFKRTTAFFLVLLILISFFSGCKKDGSSQESTAPVIPTQIPVPSETATIPQPLYTAIVTAQELNVRAGVGVKYEAVTTLKQNDTVEILEEQDLNGVTWGRIAEGWICLVYVKKSTDPGNTEVPDNITSEKLDAPITGVVIATELNVRSGPGTKYETVKTLKKDASVTITELDGQWGKTSDGWLNTVFVYFKDSLDSETVSAIVTADTLNVRSGPSTSYESLFKLYNGEKVEIYKQVYIRNSMWGYIGDGWICMDYVSVIVG